MEVVKSKSKIKAKRPFSSPSKEKYVKPLYNGLKMDVEEFLYWKPNIIDGWKYEWINGEIQTCKQKMDKKHWYIQNFIEREFTKTTYWKHGNALLSEAKCFLEATNSTRIPDLAYFTSEQILEGKKGNNPIPLFIIEIVSTFDQSNGYEQKLRDYFEVGVQCVWLIYPIFKEVKVYTSIRDIKICLEQDVCSAAPALPDFQLITDQIFE